MTKGSILLTRNDTYFGRIIKGYTDNYWTHVSLIRGETAYEFSIDDHRVMTLEELISHKSTEDHKLIENIISDTEFTNLLKVYSQAQYESLQGIAKVYYRSKNGRNNQNIQTKENKFTCSSLAGIATPRRYQDEIHWSQALPDDFDVPKIYKK